MALGWTPDGYAGYHRDLGGHGIVAGIAEMIVKISSLGITRISVLKKVCLDQKHGSAWWSRACQRAAQSPRGGFLTAPAAPGNIIFFYPPCLATRTYAAPAVLDR
jgi:hypothetical protein